MAHEIPSGGGTVQSYHLRCNLARAADSQSTFQRVRTWVFRFGSPQFHSVAAFQVKVASFSACQSSSQSSKLFVEVAEVFDLEGEEEEIGVASSEEEEIVVASS